ncbi:hypothetical protein NAT51_11945 [Flavobacterium amniphilum]|uniref:hypothetical protein n=1 Tax=Flavobacterium amniphilum TaxID=1834035 RepID=UPI00202ABF71|nr:hypothetical protein [Flavobacterium amniphilum]MCL9806239.1 hypothetical protein [Flavobacterium amniphilum]
MRVLQLVENSISGFDPNNSNDLIKAEKVLKAESKINDAIQTKEIDNVISFFKRHGSKFDILLSNRHIQSILNGKTDEFKQFSFSDDEHGLYEISFNPAQNQKYRQISESVMTLCEEFSEVFAITIWKFIQKNIVEGNWKNLRKLVVHYEPIISFDNWEQFKESLTQKNELVMEVIPFKEKYTTLINEYKFGIDEDYYSLLSDIDAFYFADEVMRINSFVVDHQHVDFEYRIYLGKVLFALAAFEDEDEVRAGILAKNRRIAQKWITSEKKASGKIRNAISKALDFDPGAAAEWTMVLIYFPLLIWGYHYLYTKIENFWFYVIVVTEIILYVIFRNKIAGDKEEEKAADAEKAKTAPVRIFLKNLGLRSFLLQIFIVVVGVFIALFLAALGILAAIAFYTGGAGVVAAIIIYRIFRKK